MPNNSAHGVDRDVKWSVEVCAPRRNPIVFEIEEEQDFMVLHEYVKSLKRSWKRYKSRKWIEGYKRGNREVKGYWREC
jgi:hypothetical protein